MYLQVYTFISDAGRMEGVVVSHQHTCSQDSSDSGSLPPTYSRLPPDGHEFPEGEKQVSKLPPRGLH